MGTNIMRKIFSLGMLTIMLIALAWRGAEAQKGATELDVQHYKIDAELVPSSQLLKGRAEVRFVPQVETRSVIFEMNGSLTINRITRADAPHHDTGDGRHSCRFRRSRADFQTDSAETIDSERHSISGAARSGRPAIHSGQPRKHECSH